MASDCHQLQITAFRLRNLHGSGSGSVRRIIRGGGARTLADGPSGRALQAAASRVIPPPDSARKPLPDERAIKQIAAYGGIASVLLRKTSGRPWASITGVAIVPNR